MVVLGDGESGGDEGIDCQGGGNTQHSGSEIVKGIQKQHQRTLKSSYKRREALDKELTLNQSR